MLACPARYVGCWSSRFHVSRDNRGYGHHRRYNSRFVFSWVTPSRLLQGGFAEMVHQNVANAQCSVSPGKSAVIAYAIFA